MIRQLQGQHRVVLKAKLGHFFCSFLPRSSFALFTQPNLLFPYPKFRKWSVEGGALITEDLSASPKMMASHPRRKILKDERQFLQDRLSPSGTRQENFFDWKPEIAEGKNPGSFYCCAGGSLLVLLLFVLVVNSYLLLLILVLPLL